VTDPGGPHLKSWLVEAWADGERWWEADHKEDNAQLNGQWFTGTFEVVTGALVPMPQ
jgi:hypothetical protein